jgi:hypothetical protein
MAASKALPYLGEPAAIVPRQVTEGMATRGFRAQVSQPEGFHKDYRVVADPFTGDGGRLYVRLCTEKDYYVWMHNGTRPETTDVLAELVFIE